MFKNLLGHASGDAESSYKPAPAPAQKVAVMSQQDVRAMRNRFRQAIADDVQKALPADASPQFAAELMRLALLSKRDRSPLNAKRLKSIAASGYGEVHLRVRQLATRPPFSLGEIRNYRKMATEGASDAAGPFATRYDHIFPDADTHRVYLPMLPDVPQAGDYISETHAQIAIRLQELGFKELDYQGGYVTDWRKNKVKLTKVLTHNLQAPHLAEAFRNDPARNGQDKLCVVISRHPYDVARMSTGRGWQSCMSKGGLFSHHMRDDMREGTLVAYLISRNDPEINDPLSRMLLKPFRNKKGETILAGEPMYGISSPAFRRTVQAFAGQIANPGKSGGKYRMAGNLYADGRLRDTRHISDEGRKSASAFLRDQGIRHIRVGKAIWAWGDVNIRGVGLDKLPDLSGVTLYGDFNAADNALTDLKGFPRHVSGRINLTDNRLRSLAELKGRKLKALYCSGNLLQTLADGPRKVKEGFRVKRNPLCDLAGVGDFGYLHTPFGRFDSKGRIPEHLRQDYRPKDNPPTTPGASGP